MIRIGTDTPFTSAAADLIELRTRARTALPALPGARLVGVLDITRESDQHLVEFDLEQP